MEDALPKLKTYGPLLGGAVLILSTILTALGYTDLAKGLEGVGAVTGISDSSPVDGKDITALVTAVGSALGLGVGIFLKLRAAAAKAKE